MSVQKKAGDETLSASIAQVEAETQDEIEKIMSEIEELQQEMDGSDPVSSRSENLAAASTSSEPVVQIKPKLALAPEPASIATESRESPLEETLSDLKPEPSVGSSLLDHVPHSDERSEGYVKEATNEGNLTLMLTGNMTMKLKCDFEGVDVTIGFGNQVLTVQLSDGAEFKIPLRRNSLKCSA